MYRPSSVTGIYCSKSTEYAKSKNAKSRDYYISFLSDHVQDFCWIHGTRFIDKESRDKLQKSLGNSDFNPYCDIEASEANKTEAGSATDLNPDTVYYQWVPIIFLLNAVMFSIPFYYWNWAEGGFTETFTLPKNQSSKVCEEFETKREDLR